MSESLTSHLESHPPIAAEPPDPGPPMTLERPHSLSGLGVTAMVMIWLVVLADLAVDVDALIALVPVEHAMAQGKPLIGLDSSTPATFAVTSVASGLYILAGVAFMVWLWCARTNAEKLYRARHTRSRGWVWGGWMVPFVSLWFPFQIVRDVRKASRPEPAPAGPDTPVVSMVGLWWTMFLVMNMVNLVASMPSTEPDPSDYLAAIALIEMVGTAVGIVAAILITLIIAQVSRWQEAKLSQSHGGGS